MKLVDPGIKLGAVIYYPSIIPDQIDNKYESYMWSNEVISRRGKIADFYIQHKYTLNGGFKKFVSK
jgi:hypothetical protein